MKILAYLSVAFACCLSWTFTYGSDISLSVYKVGDRDTPWCIQRGQSRVVIKANTDHTLQALDFHRSKSYGPSYNRIIVYKNDSCTGKGTATTISALDENLKNSVLRIDEQGEGSLVSYDEARDEQRDIRKKKK